MVGRCCVLLIYGTVICFGAGLFAADLVCVLFRLLCSLWFACVRWVCWLRAFRVLRCYVVLDCLIVLLILLFVGYLLFLVG